MPLNQRPRAIHTCGIEIGSYLRSKSWRFDARHWRSPVPLGSWFGSASLDERGAPWCVAGSLARIEDAVDSSTSHESNTT